jgi:hypothetical protein
MIIMLQKILTQFLLLACLLPVTAQSETEQVDTENPTEAAAEKPAAQDSNATEYYLPNLVKKRATSLLEHMRLFNREDEIVTLTSNEQAFYGLFLQEASGEPQGGILILHDDQQHGHWPAVIAPIREYLPLYGWATLSIELPDLPAIKQPARSEISSQQATTEEVTSTEGEDEQAITQASDPVSIESSKQEEKDNQGPALSTDELIEPEASDQDNEPALPRLQALPEPAEDIQPATTQIESPEIDETLRYQQDNKDRILAAIDYLKARGQFNLVILGYGVGAAWAIDYVNSQSKDDPEQKGLTLVTIDALPSRFTPNEMYQQIKKLKVPFLDLIHPDQKSSLVSGKKRQRIMRRAKNSAYQQIITASVASYEEGESPTSRRIRGWLKTNAGGTLVKMNQ